MCKRLNTSQKADVGNHPRASWGAICDSGWRDVNPKWFVHVSRLGGDPPALEGTRHWWVQLWGGPSKSRASGAPNGFWAETETPTVKVGYPKGLWFIELDAGYPESNEDRWIKEMFDVIVHMSSVRSIETKYNIHMYNSTKTHVQSQCLNAFLERTLRSRFRGKKVDRA